MTAKGSEKLFRVACDIQPALNEKTGIGWLTYEISRRLCERSDMQVTLEAFASRKKQAELTENVYKKGIRFSFCRWVPLKIYKWFLIFTPLPRSLFFRGEYDARIFFSYYLPVNSSRSFLFVHDMISLIRDLRENVKLKERTWIKLMLPIYCKRADGIFTVSEYSKNDIVKYLGINPDKISVIYPGVDSQRFYPTADSEDENTTIRKKYSGGKDFFLYVGIIETRKNLKGLISAYKSVLHSCGNPDDFPLLILAGLIGWDGEKITSLVKELNLEDKVIFTGYVPDDDVPRLMRQAVAFVFPSFYEGFGMPPAEAMACGTPVIVSNRSSLPEVVGDAGILVEPDDEKALAEALDRLFKNEKLRQELAVKSLARADFFSWDKAVDQIVAVIKQ